MSNIASYFLINVIEANTITGYSIKSPVKKIRHVSLEKGIYICFIEETILTKNADEQFCEVLYKEELIIIRYKDIVKLII